MNPTVWFALKLIAFLLALPLVIVAAVRASEFVEYRKLARRKVGAFLPSLWPETSFWQLHRRMYPAEAKYYVAVNRGRAKRFVRIGGAK